MANCSALLVALSVAAVVAVVVELLLQLCFQCNRTRLWPAIKKSPNYLDSSAKVAKGAIQFAPGTRSSQRERIQLANVCWGTEVIKEP